MKPFQSLTHTLFGAEIERQINTRTRAIFAAAAAENERTITRGIDWSAVYRDRYDYQRQTVLEEAIRAWRLNPIARRITELTKEFTTSGVEFTCKDQRTHKFLLEFWNHPLNHIDRQLGEWSDELALTGNLFPIITTDSAGMSYVRIYPTDMIAEINTAENDVRQEKSYLPCASADNPDPANISNYFYSKPLRARNVMLHYAVNRLAGMKWGEADIAPLLPWLARYASFLEDRVRLNRYRQAFLWDVLMDTNDELLIQARKKEIMNNPPQPGDINVHGKTETWEAKAPNLASAEADHDGLALKKFIAAGQGIPLHFLAEPESSTRTTAEAAGTPTFKHFEDRQDMFLALLHDVMILAVERRFSRGDTTVDPKAEIEIRAADISERDNASLALASSQVITSFKTLLDAGLIAPEEYMRIVYRFSGEVLPTDEVGSTGNDGVRPAPNTANANPQTAPHSKSQIKVNPDTGEVTTTADQLP
jgi:hypothetical protein